MCLPPCGRSRRYAVTLIYRSSISQTGRLSAMRRGITKQGTEELIARLRREVPGIAIRTTLLVGFPGESEEDFAELTDFVERQRFERLGVFPYSAEEGTPSAEMADDVPEEVKQARVERIMELQRNISHEANVARIGRKAPGGGGPPGRRLLCGPFGIRFAGGRPGDTDTGCRRPAPPRRVPGGGCHGMRGVRPLWQTRVRAAK